ncbi:hypothetical protein KDW_40650 [Dictyobacter vulcani]|uniref:DUF4097 domain-containing protein n=2 Tax=Dictyobacter vulcani TaxID=2607529 RepID=A0A5J4KQM8_9CHLR|nr:hypothetical protein KDW_40650 [Dictyobacter vulcani]
MITPLHPKLSISLYTHGMIYRKGRNIRVVRWEEIQSIQRQCKVYRRKGEITHVSPAYTCTFAQMPDLVLSAAIDDVAEVGTFIEQELTRRLLPQLQANYQAGQSIEFSTLSLTQQYIGNWEQEIAWTHVSRVEIDPENLVIEHTDNELNLLTIPLTDITNVCVLEVLLEYIRVEKGFELSLFPERETQDVENITVVERPGKRLLPRKTSWISTLMLTLLILSGLPLETWAVRDSFSKERLTELPSQTFQVSGPPTLIIKVDAIGKLFMLNKDKNSNTVSVSGWKTVTGMDSLDDVQQHATQNGNTINLNWAMEQTTFLGVGSEKVDLWVDTPASSNVQIETRTGDLVISSLHGEIKIKTQSGHINLQARLQGHSQLQSTSGRIDYCGTLDPQSHDLFESGSGNINLTLLSNAAFSLPSSSNLHRISNDFGNNEVGMVPRAHLDVTTHTGRITIHKGNAPGPEGMC